MGNDIKVNLVQQDIQAPIVKQSIDASIDNQSIQTELVKQNINANIDKQEVIASINGAIVSIVGQDTKQVFSEIITGEAISALKVLRNDITNTAFIADSSDTSEQNRIIGISRTAASSGFNIEYIMSGELEDSSWSWDVSKPIFFNTSGTLTQTPPISGISTMVAVPITNKKIKVKIDQGIKLT